MWLKCLILMCATYGAVYTQAPTTPPPTDPLTITEIHLPEGGDLVLCFTGSEVTYTSSILAAEPTNDPSGTVFEYLSGAVASQCFTYNDAAADFTSHTGSALTLLLSAKVNAREGELDGIGSADILVPNEGGLPAQITVDEIEDADGLKSIRVREDLGQKDFHIGVDSYSCPITTGDNIRKEIGPPCYFMDKASNHEAFSVCTKNGIGQNGASVTLCTDDIKTNSVINPEHVAPVTSETTSVTLDQKTKAITLQGECSTSNAKAEMVIRTGSGPILKMCQMELLDGECKPGGASLAAEYDLFITYTEEDKIKVVSYDKISIANRDLNGVSLTPDILEVSWIKDDSAPGPYDQLTRDIKGDETSSFFTADVDCSHMTGRCYAYFTGLVAGETYKLTLGKIINWTPDETPMDMLPQLESASATMKSEEAPSKINEVMLLRDNSQADGYLQVCFEASERKHGETVYETVLIDEDNHWIKLYNPLMRDTHFQCFSSINLFNSALRLSRDTKITVVVVEREVNGSKVLAFGQAKVALADQFLHAGDSS